MIEKRIFVFGSNLAGKHGAGSAYQAMLTHGAKWGVGVGITGKSYAIPSKDENFNILPISEIKKYVDVFIKFAYDNNNIIFDIVNIGCGLAGYKPEEIAPLFKNAPENCKFTKIFDEIIKKEKNV